MREKKKDSFILSFFPLIPTSSTCLSISSVFIFLSKKTGSRYVPLLPGQRGRCFQRTQPPLSSNKVQDLESLQLISPFRFWCFDSLFSQDVDGNKLQIRMRATWSEKSA